MRNFNTALVLAASVVLTGCFVSEEPLIDVASSDQPIMTGQYTSYELNDVGDFVDDEDPWVGEIVYQDGYLHSETDDMPLEGGLFRTIAPGIHVGMGGEGSGEDEPYSYVLVFTWPDGRVSLHLPMCEHLTEASIARLDLELEEYATCTLTSWDQAEDAFTTYLQDNEGHLAPNIVMYPVE
jgi:hypothetical protein